MVVQQGKKTIDSITKSGFLQFLPSHCFETYSVKFYGKEKLSAKILRIYTIELDENSQNYPSIKVRMECRVTWSVRAFHCQKYCAMLTSSLVNGVLYLQQTLEK
jgi:hypothetical protein